MIIIPVSYTHLDVYKRQDLDSHIYDLVCGRLSFSLRTCIGISSAQELIVKLVHPAQEGFDFIRPGQQLELVNHKSQINQVENSLALLLAETPRHYERGTLSAQHFTVSYTHLYYYLPCRCAQEVEAY